MVDFTNWGLAGVVIHIILLIFFFVVFVVNIRNFGELRKQGRLEHCPVSEGQANTAFWLNWVALILGFIIPLFAFIVAAVLLLIRYRSSPLVEGKRRRYHKVQLSSPASTENF